MVVLVFMIPFRLWGQNESSLNKDIIFRKEGRIELPNVTRNYEKVTYNFPKQEIPPQQYGFTTVLGEVARLETKIRIRPLNPDSLKKLYANYVKAGFGNYVTPYLEGYFSSKRSDKFVYNLHLRHLSSSRGPVSYSRSSNNIAEVSGTYFLPNVAVDGRLSYQRNRYNFYGYNHEQITQVREDSLKLLYNTFNARVAFRNLNTKSKLNYTAGLNYWNLSSTLANENEILINFKPTYWLKEGQQIEVPGIYSYSVRKDTIASYGRSFFQIKPAFSYQQDRYKILAGLTFAYASDTVMSPKFHVYPRLYGEYYLKKDELAVFAGLQGAMQKNTLRSFSLQNPWLSFNLPLINTNKTIEIYGGVKGNVLERLNYKAQITYQNYRYLYFFANSASDSSRFTLLYDPNNTSVVNGLLSLSYDFTEKLRAGINANFYHYNTSLGTAWQRPTTDISFLMTYNLYKKIFFNLDIFYLSGIKGKNLMTGQSQALPNIVDVNAKIDYRFSNVFSAFIQANNILSKKYQRYLYYPVKGINVLVGVSYAF